MDVLPALLSYVLMCLSQADCVARAWRARQALDWESHAIGQLHVHLEAALRAVTTQTVTQVGLHSFSTFLNYYSTTL